VDGYGGKSEVNIKLESQILVISYLYITS